jgi:ribosomal protein S18 acetylase RimI-like enzyme
MDPVTVRQATTADVPAVTEIARTAYSPYIEEIGVRPRPLDADYAGAVADQDTWVAVQDGRVVGLLILRMLADHALIENVAVSPETQRAGIGSRLLGFAEDQARQQGRPELRLYTHVRMTRNVEYYTRRGFQEISRESGHEMARVFMTKRL